MNNLVVVSNRIARAKANEPMTGGLAAALLPVVEKNGATWVGSSGRLGDNQSSPLIELESLGRGTLALLDLPAAHYGGYYQGFANSALWPALHSRCDLIRASAEDYRSYREVNAFVAEALTRFRKPETVYWIQDYHFLALAPNCPSRCRRADRIFFAYALARPQHCGAYPEPSPADRGDAGL